MHRTPITLDGGSCYMFKGIVRGCSNPPLTYYAESIETFYEALIIENFIYYIRKRPIEGGKNHD